MLSETTQYIEIRVLRTKSKTLPEKEVFKGILSQHEKLLCVKLWVQHQTAARTNGPTRVAIGDCEYVDDFLKEIKKEFANSLAAYDTSQLTLYQPDGKTEIKPTATIQSLGDAGTNGDTPLIVKIFAPLAQPTALFSPCQIAFYNNIINATEKGKWISFGQDITSTSLKKLYIRESYRIIASSIKPGINKAIITGTPGIGKSLFLVYLLWKLVKEGKRVLFIYHSDTIYYDGQGGVFYCPEMSLPSSNYIAFWSSDLWCLFDAKGKKEDHLSVLPYEKCAFVLSSSPRREMVNDFKKPPVPEVFYMPTWTETELKTIAPCFATVIDWRERFKILGGIPRHVLEDTTKSPRAMLEAACKQCLLDDCIRTIGMDSTITEKSKVIHCLVHIASTPPYTNSSVCYASTAAWILLLEQRGTRPSSK